MNVIDISLFARSRESLCNDAQFAQFCFSPCFTQCFFVLFKKFQFRLDLPILMNFLWGLFVRCFSRSVSPFAFSYSCASQIIDHHSPRQSIQFISPSLPEHSPRVCAMSAERYFFNGFLSTHGVCYAFKWHENP